MSNYVVIWKTNMVAVSRALPFLMHSFLLGMVWCAAMGIRLMITNHRLFTYLRENHTEKWIELTSVFRFGPGLGNGIRWIKFIRSKDYLGDPKLLGLKVATKNALLHVIIVIISLFILAFAIGFVCVSGQSPNP